MKIKNTENNEILISLEQKNKTISLLIESRDKIGSTICTITENEDGSIYIDQSFSGTDENFKILRN